MLTIKTLQKLTLRIAWLAMMGMALLLCFITSFYFSFRTDINFLLAKQAFIHDVLWMSAFYCHITGSMLCLLIGPLQFIPTLRKKWSKGHQLLGKIYVGSILFLGGPSGLYMAFFANGGFWTQLGFIILSILWLSSTYGAYRAIRQKKIFAHQRWMLWSYALTFSAVTLRVWVPILSIYFWMPSDWVIILTAWINWIPNIIIAEILLKFCRKNV